jgi:DNA-binding PucR family transcriptional regulator
MFQDDLLATSLRQLYLEPLAEERDGGETLRETLRAYFAAERNVSSAAAALSVNRHTVTSRLRTIEKRLGRPLSTCATEIDAALRLEDLGHPTLPHVLDSKGLDATDAR